MDPGPAPSAPALPAVVIGGYLGAGKTTLVNHLLRHAGGRRIAVLVNDFGSIDIDADLIEASDGDVLSLAGGCVCCSFGADLIGTLMATARRMPRPDLVLIELSGVALPAAAVRSARLALGIEVVATVVLADAADVRRLATDPHVGDTVRQQLHDADLLLLNKPDLVDAATWAALPAWLAAQAPQARTVACAAAEVPAELLLGWRANDASIDPPAEAVDRHGGDLARAAAADVPTAHIAPDDGLPSAFAPRPMAPLRHDPGRVFASRSAQLSEGVDLDALGRALASAGSGVLRAKALAVDAAGQGWSLQVVGARWQVAPARVAGPGRLVVIGLRQRMGGADFGVAGAALRWLDDR
ncbi:GTP-binding protein [Ideonella sp. A 288]|uniref:CobW family GTP-binding protein n=1 Tax=Ideonella sp. A 288 TaxID=1962181 RepID=UPI0013036EA7|nr:GTP-binding protein [Ideonella sp. A 288]